MKLEDQVCSLELAKKLKELGVKQESLWVWLPYLEGDDTTRWEIERSRHGLYAPVSAFTVAELGEMLPEYVMRGGMRHTIRQQRAGSMRFVSYEHDQFNCMIQNGNTEADARAKMLIYLIENNLITV